MILKITELKVVSPERHLVDVAFNDGARKRVCLTPILWGPVFEPLLDPVRFAQARVEHGAVVWNEQADFAPEALHELPDVT